MVTLFIPVNCSSKGITLNSQITKSKQLKIPNLSDLCVIPSDDVYDSNMEIDSNLHWNINIYNALVAKAHI